ncbi:MAG: DUF402 domain-containing protein [Thermomicrobiales bacterium]
MVQWQAGDQIAVRSRVFGTWGIVAPMTVMWDDDIALVVFGSVGAPIKRLRLAGGNALPRVIRPQDLARLRMCLVDDVWTGTNRLFIFPPERAYCVHAIWSEPDWEFKGWYVNLQTPLERFHAGIESEDLFLDIVVNPDRSWRWKDEDELAEAVLVGRLNAYQANDIRVEGERVAAMIDAGEWPFTSDVAKWRPDPEWSIPELPAGWDQS